MLGSEDREQHQEGLQLIQNLLRGGSNGAEELELIDYGHEDEIDLDEEMEDDELGEDEEEDYFQEVDHPELPQPVSEGAQD